MQQPVSNSFNPVVRLETNLKNTNMKMSPSKIVLLLVLAVFLGMIATVIAHGGYKSGQGHGGGVQRARGHPVSYQSHGVSQGGHRVQPVRGYRRGGFGHKHKRIRGGFRHGHKRSRGHGYKRIRGDGRKSYGHKYRGHGRGFRHG